MSMKVARGIIFCGSAAINSENALKRCLYHRAQTGEAAPKICHAGNDHTRVPVLSSIIANGSRGHDHQACRNALQQDPNTQARLGYSKDPGGSTYRRSCHRTCKQARGWSTRNSNPGKDAEREYDAEEDLSPAQFHFTNRH
jgi:hypothetical protein